MIPNTPNLEDIQNMTVESVSELPVEVLADFFEQIKEEKSKVDSFRFMLDAALSLKFQDEISAQFDAKGESLGVIYVEQDSIVLSVDKPRRVKWDESALHSLHATMTASPDVPQSDIDKYFNIKISVPEKAYDGLPASWQSQFTPARTVNAGKTTFKLKRKDAE